MRKVAGRNPYRFRRRPPAPGKNADQWRLIRISIWWGHFLYGLATGYAHLQVLPGPLTHLASNGGLQGVLPQPPGSDWCRPVQTASEIGEPWAWAVGAEMTATRGSAIAAVTPALIRSRRET